MFCLGTNYVAHFYYSFGVPFVRPSLLLKKGFNVCVSHQNQVYEQNSYVLLLEENPYADSTCNLQSINVCCEESTQSSTCFCLRYFFPFLSNRGWSPCMMCSTSITSSIASHEDTEISIMDVFSVVEVLLFCSLSEILVMSGGCKRVCPPSWYPWQAYCPWASSAWLGEQVQALLWAQWGSWSFLLFLFMKSSALV